MTIGDIGAQFIERYSRANITFDPTKETLYIDGSKEIKFTGKSALGGSIFQWTLSAETITLPDRGIRAKNSSVLYAISGNGFTEFNRLKSPKRWTYVKGKPDNGQPQVVAIIDTSGDRPTFKKITLGNPENESHCQLARFAGTDRPVPFLDISSAEWVSAKLIKPVGFSLIVCECEPGWHAADLEVINNDVTKRRFPHLLREIDGFLTGWTMPFHPPFFKTGEVKQEASPALSQITARL